ncbi:MAG: hypothetical protein RJA70_4343 [Pseudomonadota bacterium]|jgi:HSP20 family protein
MAASVQKSGRSEELPRFTPLVDIFENARAFTVVLDLPGVVKDQIQVSVEGGTLEVEARREQDSVSFHYARSFSIPDSIERDKISAEYKAGVLTLTLPKNEAQQPRRIQIQAA